MAHYALTSFDRDGQPEIGIVVENKTYDCMRAWDEVLGASLISGNYPIHEMVENLDEIHPQLEELANGVSNYDQHEIQNSSLRAPILYPPSIYCAAANYKEHAKELDTSWPMGDELTGKPEGKPYFFLKIPHICVIGPGESILLPANSKKVDWEVELGVIIGKGGSDISIENALDHVAGYTCFNDISARDRNIRPDWKFTWDWFAGKTAPTFAPMGPFITPKAYIQDPNKLDIKLWVNEVLKQDSNTEGMIFNIQEQISYLSTLTRLCPGDVIATGTPEGVGMGREEFLKQGDIVTIEIEGIGKATNPVNHQ